jgi:hypothetical protein
LENDDQVTHHFFSLLVGHMLATAQTECIIIVLPTDAPPNAIYC